VARRSTPCCRTRRTCRHGPTSTTGR
jgi:hypothetical protein